MAKAIIEEAKKIGYKFMKLDTSFRQVEAQKLYEGFGFKRIGPYYDLPDKLKSWLGVYGIGVINTGDYHECYFN